MEEVKIDLKQSLKLTVEQWVDRTFNFLHLEVVEKWSDNSLFEHIRVPQKESIFPDWLWEMDSSNLIEDYCVANNLDFSKYSDDSDLAIEDCFIRAFSDLHWQQFMESCFTQYEDDIDSYISEQENYPLWNTLFEFRHDYYNSDEDAEKCMKLGLGVIEGLEPFNNIVFMTSGGHSFYSAYWIPLYLELYPDERLKYKEVDYSDL